jgi:hypothetical protein
MFRHYLLIPTLQAQYDIRIVLLSTMCDLPSNHGRDALVKVDGSLSTEGVRSAKILLFILRDKLAYERGSFWGGVSVGQPGFKDLSQTISDDLLSFQAASCKEG